ERLRRNRRTAIAQTALAFEQRTESQNGGLIEPLRNELNSDRQVLGAEAEYRVLADPKQGNIQVDLFYDYRTNVASYPVWDAWLRDHRPKTMVLWGKYDRRFSSRRLTPSSAMSRTPRCTSLTVGISHWTPPPTRSPTTFVSS
ncbi:MAG: hypothetical protein WCB80_28980, partial [Mycobacterium sp.]